MMFLVVQECLWERILICFMRALVAMKVIYWRAFGLLPPDPFLLDLIHYTLYFTPYTLYFIPYALCLIPYTWTPRERSRGGPGGRRESTEIAPLYCWYLIPVTCHLLPVTCYLSPVTWHLALITWYLILVLIPVLILYLIIVLVPYTCTCTLYTCYLYLYLECNYSRMCLHAIGRVGW